jgi:endonuclease-3
MLSAQTTDVNVNKVTPALFEKYRTPEDYLAVPVEELERDIYATGFFRQKAKSIRGTMRMLLEEFDGKVPGRLEDLVRLPGVARKTANVVAAELGHAQGIVVDTHVRRLSQRLGLTRNDDPVKIERDLQRVVPRADWARFPHLLIWHGRRGCAPTVVPEVLGIRAVEPTRRSAIAPSIQEFTMDHAATMRRVRLLNAGDIDVR